VAELLAMAVALGLAVVDAAAEGLRAGETVANGDPDTEAAGLAQ